MSLLMSQQRQNFHVVVHAICLACKLTASNLCFALQAMFAAQLIGMLSGCFLAPATFQMFVAGQPDLGEPGSVYPAPFAQVYRNMAVVGVGGAAELGKHCLWVGRLFLGLLFRVHGGSCCAAVILRMSHHGTWP